MAEKVSPVNGQPLPKGRQFTSETAREARRKRTEKEREQASITANVKRLLAETVPAKDGTSIPAAEGVAKAILKAALSGNPKMIELLLDIAGEKPVQRVEVSTIDESVREDVDRLISEALLDGTDTQGGC